MEGIGIRGKHVFKRLSKVIFTVINFKTILRKKDKTNDNVIRQL